MTSLASLASWSLDPTRLHLNHGSFGAVPVEVQQAQAAWRTRYEADPTTFVVDEYMDLVAGVRHEVATFVGADPAGLVLVPNATTGVATALHAVPLSAGDEVVVTDHAYNACRNAVDVRAAEVGARVVVATVPFVGATPEDVEAAVLARVTSATRLVLVDHVTSATAMVWPLSRITALEPDVTVIVDGAHAPGMLPLELERLGCSFYSGNLHKWVCAPRPSAFLWAGPAWREELRPLVVSHGWNTPWGDPSRTQRLFDWTGTGDPSPWLSVPDALRVVGQGHPDGWPGVMAANHELAVAGGRLVAAALGAELPVPEGMLGSMVALPLPRVPVLVREELRDRGITAQVSFWPTWDDQLLRLSAHSYNRLADYERLAEVLPEILSK